MSERKEKIKSIAIVFLSIMLVLTFFSNTIMNYSLVEVSTQMVYGDKITTKVRGSGTVEAAEGYSVTINESRKIATVKVKTGAEVEEGDVLFTLAEGDSVELENAKKALEAAEKSYEDSVLNAGITIAERQQIESGEFGSLTERQTILLNAQATYDAAAEAYEKEQANMAGLGVLEDTAEYRMEREAGAALNGANNNYINAQAAHVRDAEEYNRLVAENTDATAIEAARAKADESYGVMTSAQAELNAAQAAYNIALANYRVIAEKYERLAGIKENFKTAEEHLSDLKALYGNQSSLGTLYEAVCEARKAVQELSANTSSSEIKAPMAGTVTKIYCYAGQTVTPETIMMEIKPESEAFTLQFSVTEAQARRIKAGDRAEILYNWHGSDISACVQSIRKDPMNRTSSIVTCELTGDVNVGDYYTLSIGEQSSEYEHVVPTSCIREDSNGKFVLVIESKSTPLGNRYYARRVDIEIITSDDSKSAIAGAIGDYVYVITTTSKPIEENQQVRLATEN